MPASAPPLSSGPCRIRCATCAAAHPLVGVSDVPLLGAPGACAHQVHWTQAVGPGSLQALSLACSTGSWERLTWERTTYRPWKLGLAWHSLAGTSAWRLCRLGGYIGLAVMSAWRLCRLGGYIGLAVMSARRLCRLDGHVGSAATSARRLRRLISGYVGSAGMSAWRTAEFACAVHSCQLFICASVPLTRSTARVTSDVIVQCPGNAVSMFGLYASSC